MYDSDLLAAIDNEMETSGVNLHSAINTISRDTGEEKMYLYEIYDAQ